MSSRTMTESLSLAKARYQPNGKGKSVDNGDRVAELLRPLPLRQVCGIADHVKDVPFGTHWAKYSHLRRWDGELNVGSVRMNCGNVIRAEYRKKGWI